MKLKNISELREQVCLSEVNMSAKKLSNLRFALNKKFGDKIKAAKDKTGPLKDDLVVEITGSNEILVISKKINQTQLSPNEYNIYHYLSRLKLNKPPHWTWMQADVKVINERIKAMIEGQQFVARLNPAAVRGATTRQAQASTQRARAARPARARTQKPIEEVVRGFLSDIKYEMRNLSSGEQWSGPEASEYDPKNWRLEVRYWGQWEHDYDDYERDEDDYQDDDYEILSNTWARKLNTLVKEKIKKHNIKKDKRIKDASWQTSEKNWIEVYVELK